MTNEELKAIIDRTLAAMPGPWQWTQGDKHMMILEQDWKRMGKRPSEAGEVMICGATKCEACAARGAHCFCPRKEDAEFIAHAREDIPELLKEITRLQDCIRFHQDAEKTASEYIEKLKGQVEDMLKALKACMARLNEMNGWTDAGYEYGLAKAAIAKVEGTKEKP